MTRAPTASGDPWFFVPAALKSQRRWLVHKGKIPIHPWENAADWKEFRVVTLGLKAGQGIGFVLGGDFVGIDLDHCLDPATAAVLSEKRELVNTVLSHCPSYCEISPSGTGLHVICCGEIAKPLIAHTSGIEIYGARRYFTITGRPFDAGDVRPILNCQSGLDELYRLYAKREAVTGDTSANNADIPEGRRRNTIFKRAQAMFWAKMPKDTVETAMLALNKTHCKPPLPDEQVRGQCRDAYPDSRVKNDAEKPDGAGDGLVFRKLSEIKSKATKWVWRYRIPRGNMTLLAGCPDLGKSTAALGIAAIISRGKEWPDGSGRAETGKTLILSAEDGADNVIRPRFIAAGGDPEKVTIIEAVRKGNRRRPFSLLTDIDRLLELCRTEEPTLIIIDPISAYIGGVDSNNNSEVRGALFPLADMAEQIGAAILLISHFRKGGTDGDPLSRIAGSLAFGAAPRAAMIFIKDPRTEGRIFALPVKSNLCRLPPGLAYRIGTYLRDGIESSCTVWEPDPIIETYNEIMELAAEKKQTDGVASYLRRRGGQVTCRDLVRAHKCRSAEEAEILFKELESGGYGEISYSDSGPNGGRPTLKFQVSTTPRQATQPPFNGRQATQPPEPSLNCKKSDTTIEFSEEERVTSPRKGVGNVTSNEVVSPVAYLKENGDGKVTTSESASEAPTPTDYTDLEIGERMAREEGIL